MQNCLKASYHHMIISIFSAFAQYFLPSRNCLVSFHSILEWPWVEHKVVYLTSSFSFPLAKLSNDGSCPLHTSFWFCTTQRKRREGNGAFFSGVCKQDQYNENRYSVRYRVEKKGYKRGQRLQRKTNEWAKQRLEICLLMEVGLPLLPQADKKQSATDQRDVPPAVEITGSLLTGKPLSILKMNTIKSYISICQECG